IAGDVLVTVEMPLGAEAEDRPFLDQIGHGGAGPEGGRDVRGEGLSREGERSQDQGGNQMAAGGRERHGTVSLRRGRDGDGRVRCQSVRNAGSPSVAWLTDGHAGPAGG